MTKRGKKTRSNGEKEGKGESNESGSTKCIAFFKLNNGMIALTIQAKVALLHYSNWYLL